jgi:hypothetical protein
MQDEFDLRYGVITPIDLMMRRYPEMSKEEAIQKLQENKEIKEKLKLTEFTYEIPEGQPTEIVDADKIPVKDTMTVDDD